MNSAKKMLSAHPRKPQKDMDLVAACIEECDRCAEACALCADACLGESMVQELVRCIRLNLDCADVCAATGRVLARQTEPDGQILKAQLQTCIAACTVCGAECETHAPKHEHCRLCADSCRDCREACERLLATF